jgi:CRISPR-associated endonuclease Csn1
MTENPSQGFILGIDLGSNSLGWALIERANGEPTGLLRAGVRVFEAGTRGDRESGQEESRNRTRREARLHRRQLSRRARRQRKVFHLLQGYGLLPPGGADDEARQDLLNELDRTILASEWFRAKAESGAFAAPAQAMPYVLRAAALDEKLEPHFLGRALYHLAQRRGFLSNRLKPAKKDDDEGVVKEGINKLREEMGAARARTLGEYLAHLPTSEQRLRGRWTHRDMYKNEFSALWDAQARYHPGLLNEERRKQLFQIMFFQRPLRFDRAVIGRCELEPGEPRAARYLLISQRFRLLQAVNNLKLYPPLQGERELTAEERRKLVGALELQGDQTFAAIRKLLGLKTRVGFNLERGGEKSIRGNRTSAEFFAVFGDGWLSMSAGERADAVQYVYSFEKADKLKEAAKRKWGLDEPSAEKLSEVTFEPDYMNLSRRAMEKLLPLLEQGVTYAAARHQLYHPEQFRAAEALPELPPIECTTDGDALRRWAEHKKIAPEARRLPDPVGAVRNPGVTRSLSELRKVVNAIIRQHGKPAEIHIELARDLKKPKKQRQSLSERMRRNEAERKQAAKRIFDEVGIKEPKPDDIRKVQLAEECGWRCPYSTDRAISMRRLVGPESEFQIEHIIPFSRSLDNSFANLTLCHVEENKNKSNRTPYEAYSGDRERYAQILARVRQFKGDRSLVAAKLRRFQMTPEEVEKFLSDFTSRQLTDTAYASKLAKKYLSLLYGGLADEAHDQRVFASPGQATAYLRNEWKLNSILEDGPTTAGGRFSKERTDHRHHAVDAVAIALTSPATVKALSDAAQRAPLERRRRFASLQAPWEGFVNSVRNVVDSIVVSHRVSKKVSGALHEETNYSPPDKPGRPPLPPRTRRVVDPRLPGKRLSKPEVAHIADEQVKQTIVEKLSSSGTDDPEKAFSDPKNLPFLPNKKGPPIPIRKVRVNTSEPTFAIGKGTSMRYVTTDKNHHVEVIATFDDRGNEVDWDGRVVTRRDAYQRVKDNAPVIDKTCRQGEGYRFSLCPGELMECDDDAGARKFMVYKGVSQYTAGPVVISLLPVNDARKNPRLIRVVPNALRKWHARKVVVSPLGEVSEAHD